MNADQLQQMTFLACYNSIRTRSVLALPTPTRYADLCAYRAKLHLEAQQDIVGSKTSEHSRLSEIETEVIHHLNEMVKISPRMKNRLYYC